MRSYFLKKAEELIKKPEELLLVLGNGLKKAYSKRTILFKVWEDFLALFQLVRFWIIGEYRDAPRSVILWSIFAILYFLSPLDLIPDIFPGGYFDDIYVIQFVLRKFSSDIEKFKKWELDRKL